MKEALETMERRLRAYEHRIGFLEEFAMRATRRLGELESPDRLFELMLRVSKVERDIRRPLEQ